MLLLLVLLLLAASSAFCIGLVTEPADHLSEGCLVHKSIVGEPIHHIVENGRLKDPSQLQPYLRTSRIRRGAKVQWKDASPAGFSEN